MTDHNPRPGDRERRFTRRRVMAGLGAGALVGVGAVGTTSASTVTDFDDWVDRAPSDTYIGGIETGSVTWTRTDEPPEERLSVTFDEQTIQIDVVVRQIGLDCYELVPRWVILDGDRLGVSLDLATGEDAETCPSGESLHYQIELTPVEDVDTVVVEERFTDSMRNEEQRTRYVREPRLTLPEGVDDYDLSLHSDSTDRAEDDPVIGVDGSTIVVQGTLVYGHSSCFTVRLEELSRDGNELGATVSPGPKPLYVPGQFCTDDIAGATYTLRIDLAADAGIDQVNVTETGQEGTRTASATLDGDSDPIVDWTLETGVDDIADGAREDGPRVFFDGPTVIVEGAIGTSRCTEVAVGSMDAEDSHLELMVLPRAVPDCELGNVQPMAEPLPTTYRLTIQTSSEAAIDRVTASEMDGETLQDLQQTTARRPPALEPIEGTVPQDIDGDGIHEDFNANGKLDFPDVNTFFQYSDESVVGDHPDAYDFTGDGAVDIQDVLAMFEQV